MKKVVLENFWPPQFGDGDTNLYDNEIGWRIEERTSAGSDDTKEVFDFHCKLCPYNLELYYLEDGNFYYFDINNFGGVFQLQPEQDWDGKYIFQKVKSTDSPDYDPDYIFVFDTAQELWDKFRLNGKTLKYIIEHSVVNITT